MGSATSKVCMGAAAGKAVVEESAAGVAAATAHAEDRLASAAKLILESSGGVDGTSGIWDAQATCTNGRLLAAIDEIILLKEIQAFPVASAARRRMDDALRVAISCLVEEFLRLRVWDASQLSGRTGLRFAVEKLSVSVAASRSVSSASLAYLTGSSNTATSITTGEVSLCTLDELYASDGSESAAPDMDLIDELDLIFPASLSVLHEVSLRIIRAGYTDELIQKFTSAPCDVLERFMSIFKAGSLLEIDRTISFEDAEWWTTEDMIRRWILATKLVGKALVAMKTQLHAQSSGAFDRFKDEYLIAIAKRNIYILLRFADGFTATRSPEKLIYVLEMYEVLDDVAPGLTVVCAGGQDMVLVFRQAEVVLAKLASAVRIMAGGLVTSIRARSGSRMQNAACGVGVHPLARYAMACVESLVPHRRALDVILVCGNVGESVSSFGGLIAQLIACLETRLEEISALCGGVPVAGEDVVRGLRHLFLANNTSFILKHATDADADFGGHNEWAARSLIEQHATRYVEASWAPVVACLDATAGTGIGKSPAKMLAKFNSALEKTYRGHACREVPDPALRAALREAVSAWVVAAYSAHLLKHPKLVKNTTYTAESLAVSLSDMFEGEPR